MTRRACALLLLTLALPSCTRVYTDRDSASPSPTAPTPAPPAAPVGTQVEFRVLGSNSGTIGAVTIRHTDPINGATLYTGSVPYLADFATTTDPLFLYIEASGLGTATSSTLQVQIFVNGKLFREAFSQGYALSAQASGTYRK